MSSEEAQNSFASGDRVKLSTLGIARSPKLKSFAGIIIGKTRGDGYYVLLDSNRTPTTLHRSYLERDDVASDVRSV